MVWQGSYLIIIVCAYICMYMHIFFFFRCVYMYIYSYFYAGIWGQNKSDQCKRLHLEYKIHAIGGCWTARMCFTSSEGPSWRRISPQPTNGDSGWRRITPTWELHVFSFSFSVSTRYSHVQVCAVLSCLETKECNTGLDHLNAI